MLNFTSWDAGLHTSDPNSLEHYGVLGQKWGMRRYQNPDGSLTALGQKHYEKTGEYGYHYKSHATKKYERKLKRAENKAIKLGSKYTDAEIDGIKKGIPQKKKLQKITNKSLKLIKKASVYDARKSRSAELDRREQDYANKLSTGKAVALSLLAGGDRMKAYSQYRAMAGQFGKNVTGQKIVAGVKAARAGSIGSRKAKAAYIRQDDVKAIKQLYKDVEERGSDEFKKALLKEKAPKESLGVKAYKFNNKISDKLASKAQEGIDKVRDRTSKKRRG